MTSALPADPGPEGSNRFRGPTRVIDNPTDDTQARGAGRAFLSKPSILAVAVLVGVGVGLPIVMGAISGSLFIPREDDAAYRRIATGLFSTGQLQLNGWSSMTLIGQIFFVQPFLLLSGGASWAFTASTAVLATAGIVAGYTLGRRFLSVPRATAAVLGVLFFPGFLLDTTSYMTDVPAWSMEIVCVCLGAVALDRHGRERWAWLVASLATGCFAFSIREFAIAAPVAVLVMNMASPLGRRRRYWIAGATTLAVCCGIYVLKSQMPGLRDGAGPDFSNVAFAQLRGPIATLALVLAPALAVAVRSWWRQWRVLELLAGLAAGVALFHRPIEDAVRFGAWPRLIIGNLLEQTGSMESAALTGTRPQLYPTPLWDALNAIALIASLVFFAILGAALGAYLRGVLSRLREGRGHRALWIGSGSAWMLVALFAALYGSGICAWSLLLPTYDRYLWPLAFPLYAILLRPPGEPVAVAGSSVQTASPTWPGRVLRGASTGLAAMLLVALSLTSLTLVANADAFGAARWRMGDSAVNLGTPPGSVDAGFEWVAFHATGLAVENPALPLGGFYDSLWPSFHLCALVSNSPLSGDTLSLIKTDLEAYRLFLFAGQSEPLYLYRVQDLSCP